MFTPSAAAHASAAPSAPIRGTSTAFKPAHDNTPAVASAPIHCVLYVRYSGRLLQYSNKRSATGSNSHGSSRTAPRYARPSNNSTRNGPNKIITATSSISAISAYPSIFVYVSAACGRCAIGNTMPPQALANGCRNPIEIMLVILIPTAYRATSARLFSFARKNRPDASSSSAMNALHTNGAPYFNIGRSAAIRTLSRWPGTQNPSSTTKHTASPTSQLSSTPAMPLRCSTTNQIPLPERNSSRAAAAVTYAVARCAACNAQKRSPCKFRNTTTGSNIQRSCSTATNQRKPDGPASATSNPPPASAANN